MSERPGTSTAVQKAATRSADSNSALKRHMKVSAPLSRGPFAFQLPSRNQWIKNAVPVQNGISFESGDRS